MRTFICIIICLVITSSIQTQQKDTLPHLIQKGSWALQFEAGYDFKLTSFEGAQISLKYHFSPKIAFRIGGGVNSTINETDIYYVDYYNYGTPISEPLNEHNNEIFISTAFILYPKPEKVIKLYAGIGPRAAYTNTKDEFVYSDGYKSSRDIEGWNAGLNLIAGCEWFPVNYLSLSAEYSVYGVYGVTTRTSIITQLNSPNVAEYYYSKTKEFSFRGNTVKLGLGLYF